MRLQRFIVDQRREYQFTNLIQGDDNLANMVMRSSRSVGMNGAFDALGRGRAFSESGNVSAALQLEADDAYDLRERVDELRGMTDWGRGRLFVDAYRHNLPTRWAWARVNSIRTPENVANMPHLRMRAELAFQVAGSRWYSQDHARFMDYGDVMDSGLVMGGPQVDQVAVSDGSTVSIENRGNAVALAWVRWDVTTTATNMTVSRSDGGVLKDRLIYGGAVSAGDTVIIDCRERAVRGDGSIANLSEYSADWLAIPPGRWSLDVAMDSGAANLSIEIWDTWV